MKVLESINRKMESFAIGASNGSHIAAMVSQLVMMLSVESAHNVYKRKQRAHQQAGEAVAPEQDTPTSDGGTECAQLTASVLPHAVPHAVPPLQPPATAV